MPTNIEKQIGAGFDAMAAADWSAARDAINRAAVETTMEFFERRLRMKTPGH